MEQTLSVSITYEMWMPCNFRALTLWQVRKFVLAWENYMERILEWSAKQPGQGNSAATMIVLLNAAGVAEFTIVTFVCQPCRKPYRPVFGFVAPTITSLHHPGSEQTPDTHPGEVAAEVYSRAGNLISPTDESRISGNVSIIARQISPILGFIPWKLPARGIRYGCQTRSVSSR
jgi:hypothetical protein